MSSSPEYQLSALERIALVQFDAVDRRTLLVQDVLVHAGRLACDVLKDKNVHLLDVRRSRWRWQILLG